MLTATPDVARWVTAPRRTTSDSLRLFCFPYAGGGASLYRAWTSGAPRDLEICPVQLPGREGRLGEAPITRLTSLVQTLAEVLAPSLDPPFAFFGHSMGALISFELARQLRREGRPGPGHLFLSAHRAPHLPDPRPPIHQLPTREFWREVRRLNGTPESVLQNVELLQLLEPLLRADFALCESYYCAREAPLECPISVFGGRCDDRVPLGDLVPWRGHTRASFAVRLYPGGHFFLQDARADLLQAIAEDRPPHRSG